MPIVTVRTSLDRTSRRVRYALRNFGWVANRASYSPNAASAAGGDDGGTANASGECPPMRCFTAGVSTPWLLHVFEDVGTSQEVAWDATIIKCYFEAG